MSRYPALLILLFAVSCGGSPADSGLIEDVEGKAELSEPPPCHVQPATEWPVPERSAAFEAFYQLDNKEKMKVLYEGYNGQAFVPLFENTRLGKVFLRRGFSAVKLTEANQLRCGVTLMEYATRAQNIARTGSGKVEGLYAIEKDGERWAYEYRIEGKDWGWTLVINRDHANPMDMGLMISTLDWLLPDGVGDHRDPDFAALAEFEKIDPLAAEQQMRVFYPDYEKHTRLVEYSRSAAFRRVKALPDKLRIEPHTLAVSMYDYALNDATWDHDPADPDVDLQIYALVSKGLIYAYEFEMVIKRNGTEHTFVTTFDRDLVVILGEFDWFTEV